MLGAVLDFVILNGRDLKTGRFLSFSCTGIFPGAGALEHHLAAN
jgi:hypothetical protein